MLNYLVSKILKSELEWGFEKSDHASLKVCLQIGVCSDWSRSDQSKLANNVAIIKSGINNMLGQIPADWNPHMKLKFVKVAIRSTIANLVEKKQK